mgnify:CR=1 FL=1
MLDEYFFGTPTRISPEAPVPVFKTLSQEHRLGGAANTAANVAALGAKVKLVGVVGDDEDGHLVAELLSRAGVDTSGLIKAPQPFRTTKKRRYLTDDSHVFRTDFEGGTLGEEDAKLVVRHIQAALKNASLVLVSDYGKGLVSKGILRPGIAAASRAGVRILVDPFEHNFAHYPPSCIIKLNGFELFPGVRRDAISENTFGEKNIKISLAELQKSTNASAIIVTLGSQGACYLANGEFGTIPAARVKAMDVTGAGDTFFACLGLAISAGQDYASAIGLANLSASLSVSKMTTATTTWKELLAAIADNHKLVDKVQDRSTAAGLSRLWGNAGLTVGFTNGCFDLLHRGHISLFEFARQHCDRLVVGVNSDASVSRLKGTKRPIIPLSDRTHLLSSLEQVDLVVPFEDDTPLGLIKSLEPNILVKGEDYKLSDIVGATEVLELGGKVVRAPLVEHMSTTSIISRTQEREE